MPAEQIAAIRGFNRFSTARLGMLQPSHLNSGLSFTEARTLYEIGANTNLTASTLRKTLGLDAGYISRILASLTRRRFIRRQPSPRDAREKFLTLTASGAKKVAHFNRLSDAQIAAMLQQLSAADRNRLVDAITSAHQLLARARTAPVRIQRITRYSADVRQLLEEYFDAIHVVVRDTPADIRAFCEDPATGVWVAYKQKPSSNITRTAARKNPAEPVGCVMLRPLSRFPHASECKRLYVRPSARGLGIAGKLMDELETFARNRGDRWIYLDSKDDLPSAIAMYRRRRYTNCPRYNTNPQATIFLRKRLTAVPDRGHRTTDN